MEIHSKRKRLIKGIKYFSIAGFTFTIIATNTSNASANLLSKAWKNFKNNTISLTLSFGKNNKTKTISDIVNNSSKKSRLSNPFKGLSSKFSNLFNKGKRNESDINSLKNYSDNRSEKIILTLSPDDPKYVTPRRKRLGSINSVDSSSNIENNVTNFSNRYDDSKYDNTFITHDGIFGKINFKSGDLSGHRNLSEDLRKALSESSDKHISSEINFSEVTNERSTFDPSKKAITRNNDSLNEHTITSILYKNKRELDDKFRKTLSESNKTVNNQEVIFGGNGYKSTFNPNKEAQTRSTRDEIVKNLLKMRNQN